MGLSQISIDTPIVKTPQPATAKNYFLYRELTDCFVC